ncbi:lipopolysaccharide assembly protein LapB [Lutibacter sp.]|uniref:tetratricopeptide repeat protein n=1 Tax=Lutibacter sp. TaxID=1925666 RepID=UPI002734DE19|nr:hypothetical protein [Lutibacter sp.]MDP3312254.1 hypothetical protein [Lutibacter sp.]
MKKMRIILVLFVFVFATQLGFSQTEEECNIKYNLFKGDYKANKYDDAYENWMWCMDNCPTLTINIYKFGINIAFEKYDKASAAEKANAAKLVNRVFEQRLKHYPQDLGYVYSEYASFKSAQGAPEDEVFALLEKAFKADATDMSAKNIYLYFDMILNKYKDTDTQRVFDTYDEVGEGVEAKRAEYTLKIEEVNAKDSTQVTAKDLNNKDIYQQIISNLELVEEGLDSKLSEISTCDRLIPFNKKYFDEKKTDAQWLRRAVSRMYNKDCTSDPFYATLVEAYVKADPSSEASVFYAGILMSKGETNKAMEYFKKAVDQESNKYKRANYLLRIAQILSKQGRKPEARSYAFKALDDVPTMGRAYLLIAGLYASSANACGNDVISKRMVYVAALNMAYKAKSVDPSVSSLANKYIANYSDNAPSKKDLFVAGVQSGSSFRINCWINETVRVP